MARFIDIDPTLSEFSQEELRDAATAILVYMEDLEKHCKSLAEYPAMQKMFEDKLLEYSVRKDNLQTVVSQLINASARKEIQKRIASN